MTTVETIKLTGIIELLENLAHSIEGLQISDGEGQLKLGLRAQVFLLFAQTYWKMRQRDEALNNANQSVLLSQRLWSKSPQTRNS